MSELNQRLKKFSDEIKGTPESEEVKKFEKDLEQLKGEMKKSGNEFREKVRKDILSWLKQELERLKERLRKFGREEEVEPLEVKFDELRRI
ncbi:MAG: hypothetical protein HQ589_05335 [Syntrophaceae bacterium]|nr:hypothetical protein [Syntrophaceae bacterium]